MTQDPVDPDPGAPARSDARLAPYIPVALLRRWLDAQAATATGAAEHRFEAVCMTVDLADSTRMTERYVDAGPHGAEQLGEVLDAYFAAIADAIVAQGGIIARIAGDAVTALWPTNPSAVAAARAAYAAARAVLAVSETVAAGLAHRVAIDIGPVDLLVLGVTGERRFMLVSGAPLRAMAPGRLRGEPGEIVLAERVSELLRSDEPFMAPASGNPPPPAGLHDFAPPIVVAHVQAGLRDWLAEFRHVSAVYAGLTPKGGEDIRKVFEIIRAAAAHAGVAIWDVVDEDKGVVFKIIFGLPPYATEADAAGALEVARRIRLVAREAGFKLAVGVATGRAFFGEVGSADRREHIGVGPVMNYGARLMQAAGDHVLCDLDTALAAGDAFEFDETPPLMIRGRDTPLQARRLRDHVARHRDRRPAKAGVAPVGREEAVSLIRARIETLLDGPAEPIHLRGEPGVGKSTLLDHAARLARELGVAVIRAPGSRPERSTPFFVLRRLLATFAFPDTAQPDADATLARMRSVLASDGQSGRAYLLEDIFPSAGHTGAGAGFSGAARRSVLEDLVVRFVDQSSITTPHVLLIDDLQWIDAASSDLIAAIARRSPRVLTIAGSRSAQSDDDAQVSARPTMTASEIVLARLQPHETEALARAWFGVSRLPRRLANFLHERSDGLPLHTEQLMLSLVERGGVKVANGRFEIAPGALAGDAAPPTLRGLVTQRIDRLAPFDQLTAKVASVIGARFEFTWLGAIHPTRPDDGRLTGSLILLEAAGLVEAFGAGSFAFQHAMLRETLYDLMPHAQRAPLHAHIARRIEAMGPIEAAIRAAELAWHWEAAGHHTIAIDRRADAAWSALRAHAVADALDHAAHIERIAETSGAALAVEQRVRLERIRGDAFQELARYADAGRHFRACATHAGLALPETRLHMIRDLAIESIRHALAHIGFTPRATNPEVAERTRLAAHIHMRFAEHAYFAGDRLGVMHATLTSLNHAQSVGSTLEMIPGYSGLAAGFGLAGLAGPAAAYANRAVRMALESGAEYDQGLAHMMATVAKFPAGDWADTVHHATQGATLFDAIGDEFRGQICSAILAYAQMAVGDAAAARETLARVPDSTGDIEAASVRAWAAACLAVLELAEGVASSETAETLRACLADPIDSSDRLLCLGPMAELQWMAGDREGARRSAEEALDLLRANPTRLGIGFVSLPRIVETLTALGALERARVAARAAAAFAKTVRVARPHTHFAVGSLEQALGAVTRARAHWRRGLAAAEAMAMPREAALCREALAAWAPQPARRRALLLPVADRVRL